MLSRTRRLAEAAHTNGVRLMIDAEQTYFQPAIDHVVLQLQREFNKEDPIIFNTYQCYLKDSRARMLLSLRRSQEEGWKLGFKAVRGAYMVQESKRAREIGYDCPINDTIEHTHVTYDSVVESALRANSKGTGTEVMIASHNEDSIVAAVRLIGELGIDKASGGVYFGQLLGMRDSVSFGLGAAGYNVFK